MHEFTHEWTICGDSCRIKNWLFFAARPCTQMNLWQISGSSHIWELCRVSQSSIEFHRAKSFLCARPLWGQCLVNIVYLFFSFWALWGSMSWINKMVANQIKPAPVGETFESPEIQISSVPKKKSKPGTDGQTDRKNFKENFKMRLFVIFCSMSFASSVAIFSALIPIKGYDPLTHSYEMHLHAFIGENATNIDHKSTLTWTKQDLTYGYLQSINDFSMNVSISEVGSL